jgi:amylosucrase
VRPAECDDIRSDAGCIFQGLMRLVTTRKATPALAGNRLVGFRTKNASVLGFTRPGADGAVLVLGNFSEQEQTVRREVLSGLPRSAVDLVDGRRRNLRADLRLAPYQLCWLAH